ncbi:MAG: T9SS type A sorting domain-containing protein, partial [Imperialibacter sp.]
QEWTVTVTVAPATEPLSSAKDIISFLLHEQTGDALINTTDHTVTIEVETGTDITNLSPAITVSDKATVSPGSEVTQDFSAAVVYIVTAEDGSTQEWTATVTVKEGTKTGIAEAFANVTVYPNPATEQIKVAGLSKGSSLQLVTLNGAIINQVSSSIYEVESISLTGLTAGVYVLQVSTEGKIKSYRIIKE